MSELLDEVLVLYRRRLNEKQIHVERRYSPAKPALIFPGEMRQVFSNLITNAIEACGANGTISLRVRMASPVEEGGEPGIRITIADNGGGIPAHVRHRLGEPFFTTKGQRGTGLGLWVTRSIVQRYGGRLRLRSTQHPERHGTVFSLFLPMGKGPQANATIHTLPSEGESPGAGRRANRMPRRNRHTPFRQAGGGR
jgi:two-component system NtrC family sensor kinase